MLTLALLGWTISSSLAVSLAMVADDRADLRKAALLAVDGWDRTLAGLALCVDLLALHTATDETCATLADTEAP